jgi:predicted thioredoxin/glutaredoxin
VRDQKIQRKNKLQMQTGKKGKALKRVREKESQFFNFFSANTKIYFIKIINVHFINKLFTQMQEAALKLS